MNDFTHFDGHGNAVMVDVSEKENTQREASAQGRIYVGREVYEKIRSHKIEKGDVLSVARTAGIMGAKQTSSLIPMCHILLIHKCSIDFTMREEDYSIKAVCKVKTAGKTGVEMEALTGVQIALLTIYDMCKAVNKSMSMGEIHLLEKSGGKSGDFYYENQELTDRGMEDDSGKD
ncbi:cyclic pyranopterin monophosphate synthase MoaC [Anaerostipes sp.]|uniref:cyclic pyranopterin monophosphate synthase MoaC n=1 Tax=Anaerostipes sp. TaxID=1872530 RepID=UPI0025BAD592|nr:cyclic pyranopterin monophosphate synthase MoaC [Anaerostipes sp.]MBS7007773.1 cyclic pyranopterin monophosphate synthase MoaC [Anaerostipes sp.]